MNFLPFSRIYNSAAFYTFCHVQESTSAAFYTFCHLQESTLARPWLLFTLFSPAFSKSIKSSQRKIKLLKTTWLLQPLRLLRLLFRPAHIVVNNQAIHQIHKHGAWKSLKKIKRWFFFFNLHEEKLFKNCRIGSDVSIIWESEISYNIANHGNTLEIVIFPSASTIL